MLNWFGLDFCSLELKNPLNPRISVENQYWRETLCVSQKVEILQLLYSCVMYITSRGLRLNFLLSVAFISLYFIIWLWLKCSITRTWLIWLSIKVKVNPLTIRELHLVRKKPPPWFHTTKLVRVTNLQVDLLLSQSGVFIRGAISSCDHRELISNVTCSLAMQRTWLSRFNFESFYLCVKLIATASSPNLYNQWEGVDVYFSW